MKCSGFAISTRPELLPSSVGTGSMTGQLHHMPLGARMFMGSWGQDGPGIGAWLALWVQCPPALSDGSHRDRWPCDRENLSSSSPDTGLGTSADESGPTELPAHPLRLRLAPGGRPALLAASPLRPHAEPSSFLSPSFPTS